MTQNEFKRWWNLFIEENQKEGELENYSDQESGSDWDAGFESWNDEELAQLALQF